MNIIEHCINLLKVILSEEELLQLIDFHKINKKQTYLRINQKRNSTINQKNKEKGFLLLSFVHLNNYRYILGNL